MKRFIACLGALALLAGAAGQASAGTPKDTLVMSKIISDIITLDPAEVFEFSGGEIIANIYDRVMMYEPEDTAKLVGGVAESFAISDKGKTITLKLRPGQKFHSGNPVTAQDVAFSLRRVIVLNKTPSFIFTQFGWNADNVNDLVKATGADTVVLKLESDLSPGLVLNALSAGVGSVLDEKTVMSHEKDGDLGYDWLKNHSAGSGAFVLKTWKANELVSLEANPNYRHGAPGLKRVIIRHVPETSAQRLLLEKGDVDMARNLSPDQVRGMAGNADIAVNDYPKAALTYVATNEAHPILSKPGVRMAMRYVIDYKGMVNSFLAGQQKIHQSVWPSGMWASYDETPFSLDLDKAKSLLAEAGHAGGGFKVAIATLNSAPFPEIAQSLQANLAKIGIDSEITLAEGKTLWPMYRARKHEIIVARWGPDYADPHSNTDAFAHNPDNRAEAKLTGKLAWRTSWFNPEINALTEQAATEVDLAEREQLYLKLQKRVQEEGPFTVMFQQNDQVATRKNVQGFVSGATFDTIFYRNTTK